MASVQLISQMYVLFQDSFCVLLLNQYAILEQSVLLLMHARGYSTLYTDAGK